MSENKLWKVTRIQTTELYTQASDATAAIINLIDGQAQATKPTVNETTIAEITQAEWEAAFMPQLPPALAALNAVDFTTAPEPQPVG